MLSQFLTAYRFSKTKTVKRVRLGRPGTSLKIGLLGMANIGKSSTFNLLSNLNVPA
jgi:obg-like ATPase 1